MLFNTLAFWVFFAIVSSVYVFLARRAQNAFLLAASYFFYACWDWRFVGLLVLSSTIDWFLGNAVFRSRASGGAKKWVTTSVALNLLFLGFFKYFNFFVDATDSLLRQLGLEPTALHLPIVLPVGISFYTFQSISYIVDVYRGEIEPAIDPLDYFLFVAFFPHMVAGPIMHSTALLPQMQRRRHLNWSGISSGFNLAAWGLFKKVVVADNLAQIVGTVFRGELSYGPGAIHLGALAFAFQIYGDFSGYTDIARGVARIMGFELMVNFDHPYLSTSITDFWRRWHISLSTWLRDYLYVPLGGNRHGTWTTYRNLFMTMLLGGVWHGAGWTFLIWGAYQGVLLVLERICGGKRLIVPFENARGGKARALWLVRVLLTFHFVCLGWVIFRCPDVTLLPAMTRGFLDARGWLLMPGGQALNTFLLILPVLMIDSLDFLAGREQTLLRLPWFLRSVAYTFGLYAFLLFGRFQSNAFIYFQF